MTLEELGQGHDLNMLIVAIGGIQMIFLGHWMLSWALEALLECDLEIDPVTLTMNFQGHNISWEKGQFAPTLQTHL